VFQADVGDQYLPPPRSISSSTTGVCSYLDVCERDKHLKPPRAIDGNPKISERQMRKLMRDRACELVQAFDDDA
jgi:hypothetical protein